MAQTSTAAPQSTAPYKPYKKRLLGQNTGWDVAFHIVNYTLVTIFTLLCVAPYINQLATAFSSNEAIQKGLVTLWPVEFNTDAMKAVLNDRTVIRSLGVTVYITVVGTALNMFFNIMAAYPLSRRDLVGRQYFMNFLIFCMLFNAGMIPNYLLVRALGMVDTLWSLMIPGMISVFNVIIMKTFFQGIPDELREAAVMDGCGNTKYLVRVVLPLSTASLATLSLFYAVGHWNTYMSAIIYINDAAKYPLQVKLRNRLLLSQLNTTLENLQQLDNLAVIAESLKAAVVIFATTPILLVYPFLQRYFIHGAMLGSIKG